MSNPFDIQNPPTDPKGLSNDGDILSRTSTPPFVIHNFFEPTPPMMSGKGLDFDDLLRPMDFSKSSSWMEPLPVDREKDYLAQINELRRELRESQATAPPASKKLALSDLAVEESPLLDFLQRSKAISA
jgi:hypothetical protein